MTPHKCPVCEGRTTVPAGFYSLGPSTTNAAAETCRACDGRGIVWDCVGQYHPTAPVGPFQPEPYPKHLGWSAPMPTTYDPSRFASSISVSPGDEVVCQYVGVDGTKGGSRSCSNVE